MAPLLPPDILTRPKKGFGIPLSRWLRHLPPPPDAAARLGADGAWLAARWDEHRTGKADHRGLLWAWTALATALAGRDGTVQAEPAAPSAGWAA